ncbi:MAG TPA: general secretion pathway protein GspB [Geobacteraceae bacterium]|nr:general secretion pathway protein GspB [Geobacteraceae bacterium]
MSSILKALKKLEEEKTARRNGGTDVARGILRSRPDENRKSGWVLPVSVACSAIVAALLTYFLAGGHKQTGREDAPVPPVKVASDAGGKRAQVQVTAPAIPESAAHPVDTPVPATAVDSYKKKEAVRAVAAPLPARPPVRFSEKKVAKMSSDEQLPDPGSRMLQKNTPVTANTPDVHSPPALRVTGIAWNRDSSERLAVVNGMPVNEGTTIEGARVEQIMKDKVRFSFENKTFDVAVGSEMR